MKSILAVDPGLNACGWAARIGERPIVPGTIRPKTFTIRDRVNEIIRQLPRMPGGRRWDILVVEKPQVYEGRKSKGDPNDLVNLALVVGAVMATIPAGIFLDPLPNAWKGAVPKHIHHRRIRRRVPGLPRCSMDAMDAVGLLLYGEQYA
jgi:hypothetical protein